MILVYVFLARSIRRFSSYICNLVISRVPFELQITDNKYRFLCLSFASNEKAVFTFNRYCSFVGRIILKEIYIIFM